MAIAMFAACAAPRRTAGTLDDPVPPGQRAEVGCYEIAVLGVVPDAREQVLAENPLNDPPPPGRAYPLVRVRHAG